MIRTLPCACSAVATATPATVSRQSRKACVVLVMVESSNVTARIMLLRALGLSHHPRLEGLPLGVVLRGEVLAAVVIEVAARRFLERVHQEAALEAAGHHEPAHDIEVLP